jgi:hypothetical protein
MIVSDPSVLVPELPAIDVSEAHWAIEYLNLMIEKLGADSPVSLVLMQTRRELRSLTQSTPAQVIGPFRIAA